MTTETFYVETFSGAKCFVNLEVVAKKEGHVLVKGLNCYKELVEIRNGKSFWTVDSEYNEIPEEWRI